MPKTLLVTGASTGLGVALSVQAAQAGFETYATMRNLDKRATLDAAAAAAGVTLNVLQLDVEDTASVEAAVAKVIANHGRIDVLVANAGVGFVRSTEQATEEEIRWVMDVNFMGLVRSTKAVIGHMRQARSGRIIAISSVGGLAGQPFNEIYCASKFAVEGYIEGLASYVGPAFGLHFTVVEPGGISSEFANSVLARLQDSGGMLEDEYLPLLQRYIGSREGRSEGVFQTPDEVAKIVIRCATQDTPPIRTRTSDWSEQITALKTSVDPDGRKLQAQILAEFMPGLESR
ncbi:SDR family oxidoreductase [Sulfitobacter sp. TSTF-M16]|uniref:SDR family oxidoreductase n=2 Tax=Sulfitobacter aestuariivivens TaxID=2766981 RepID=A0A927HF94_9RHOB|nr:SDR family oxidoreductase [Sulfitobacter aestuariivivens]MBD3664194.1 SDR family oxidoreductase [Sulfitobacter aestuariivivens]